MKYTKYILWCLILCAISACSKDDKDTPINDCAALKEAKDTMSELWNTRMNKAEAQDRQDAFKKIQVYADDCSSTLFNQYLNMDESWAESLEQSGGAYSCYNLSFEKVLDEVKNQVVAQGTAQIWLLYNMGYIVKTPSGCFGIDICHRSAAKLAPYLDFYCITHNHSDHYSKALINAMRELDKPVLSNYLFSEENYKYTSKTNGTEYQIGKFNIYTCLNDHNTTLKNFVTTYQIDCGDDSGNLVLLHMGDSNYTASQLTVTKHIDVFIPRYAVNDLTENNVLGVVVKPKYCLLSHILELTHAGVDESRWSLPMALKRASLLNCEKTYVPFWGERYEWSNGELK